MRSFLIATSLMLFAGAVLAQYRFPPVYEDYTAGSAKALKAGTPLVTFVGCQPFEVAGAVVCMTHYLPEYPAQCIVLSKDGYWKATLPMGSKCEDVCKEVGRLSVRTFQERIAERFAPIMAAPVRTSNC